MYPPTSQLRCRQIPFPQKAFSFFAVVTPSHPWCQGRWLCSLSLQFPFYKILYKWTYIVFYSLLLSVSVMSKIYPGCCVYYFFFPFHHHVISYSMLTHSLFFRSLVDGHMGYLQLWFILNKAAMNIHVYICVNVYLHLSSISTEAWNCWFVQYVYVLLYVIQL